MLVVNSRLQIPLEEFEFTYTRSSGPGGQNVNKVNSKACLRWPALASPSLPPGVRARFLQKFGARITVEGDMLIVSQRYRDQERAMSTIVLRSCAEDAGIGGGCSHAAKEDQAEPLFDQTPVRREAADLAEETISRKIFAG